MEYDKKMQLNLAFFKNLTIQIKSKQKVKHIVQQLNYK
jgi:hypothetical protein